MSQGSSQGHGSRVRVRIIDQQTFLRHRDVERAIGGHQGRTDIPNARRYAWTSSAAAHCMAS